MQLRQLALFAVLAAPAWGQTTVEAGRIQQQYTNGPYVCRNGLSMAKGTTGNACAISDVAGTAGLWIQGDWARRNVEQGAISPPAATDAARRTGSLPCTSSGTPQYPFTIVCWVNTLATDTSNDTILDWYDDASTAKFSLCQNGSQVPTFIADDGSASNGITLTTALTTNLNVCLIAVVEASDSRYFYSSLDTGGGTSTTDRVVTGLDGLVLANTEAIDRPFGPNALVMYTAILPVNLGGAGMADARAAIYAGADPVVAAGLPQGTVTRTSDSALGGVWRFPAGALTDSSGNGFDLTEVGTLTESSPFLVVRDQSANTNHMLATTSAPTYDGTIMNGQGGGTYVAASSQFLVCESTPITAAPFQVYAVASRASSHTGGVFWLGDKDAATDFWDLRFSSTVVRFVAADGGAPRSAEASSETSTDTAYLLWGSEVSGVSRLVEIDGGGQGTNTTDTTPDSADRMGLGGTLDSSPGNYLNGSIGFVLLLDTAATTDQARVETFTNTVYNLGF